MSKIGQERKNEIIEDGSREFLLGKNIEDVMKDLGPRIERYKLDADVIQQKIKEETGDVFLKLPKDDKNLSVNYLKTQQLYDDAIERIVKNEDPEKVILDTDEKLEKLGIGEDDRDQVIQKILKSFELPDKEKETADILLKESGETIKLPRLDENYDDAKELKLKKDVGGILPDRDTDMFTDKNYVISKKIDSGPEKFGKKLETTGELIVETQKLSQYIQQYEFQMQQQL